MLVVTHLSVLLINIPCQERSLPTNESPALTIELMTLEIPLSPSGYLADSI